MPFTCLIRKIISETTEKDLLASRRVRGNSRHERMVQKLSEIAEEVHKREKKGEQADICMQRAKACLFSN